MYSVLATALLLAAAAALPTPHTDPLSKMPAHMTLHAPFTPFKFDAQRSLNATTAGIEALAKQAASFGVNTVWVPGGMGQFETLSVSERKQLLELWAPAAKKHNIYLIAHVGTNSIGEAKDLATHAAGLDGVDAIASVPPFYEHTTDVDAIVDFLAAISAAAPALPMFYYHIPAMTLATIKVAQLFAAANATDAATGATRLPALAGVKYVSPDLHDWFELVTTWNATKALLFAPEPKLASFSLGTGKGCVLAEDFYAPTYLRMRLKYYTEGQSSASAEQAWKYSASAVVSSHGGSAERVLYRTFPYTKDVIDLGPPRLPATPFDEAQYDSLIKGLQAVGFYNQMKPPGA